MIQMLSGNDQVVCVAILDVVREHATTTGFVYGFWIPDLVKEKLSGCWQASVTPQIVQGWMWELINDGYLNIDPRGRVTSGPKTPDGP